MGETFVPFGKYTTLVEGTYYSDPFEVTGYKTALVEVFNAAVVSSGTLSVQMQQSSDLITWTDIGSAVAPSADALGSVALSGTARYLRAEATVGGGGSGVVTFWVKGVVRDS